MARGPLRKNVNFVKRSGGEIVHGRTSKPLCQEILINLGNPGSKIKYTHTGAGSALPLTAMACTPRWNDYFHLNETIPEMVKHLIEEDEEEVQAAQGGAPAQKDNVAQVAAIPPDDDTIMTPALAYHG